MTTPDFKLFSLPNILTSMNIVCGTIAVIISLSMPERMAYSALFILIGSVFDFLDGMLARLTKSFSSIGKDLDSLADMITFGLAPGMIVFQLLASTFSISNPDFSLDKINFLQALVLCTAFIVPVFSALRLAKFNIDTRQSESFIGLATPANALLISSLPVALAFNPEIKWLSSLILNFYLLIPLVVVLSLLLISEIPMFSLKFKNLRVRDNKIRYIFIGLLIVLLITLKTIAFPLIICVYILLSVLNNVFINKKAA
ncbi:MAG: CDP-diacylglycerol--serine O-phosphatidyltransferase [Bacteroidia bacterium]|nr:MAG: CDP-diacylglycerol--serine O-phosphatidyltransferase [Bacteroidia bacterium]